MRIVLAALLMGTVAQPVLAQERAPAGSGVAPATAANSAVRPIGFATRAAAGGVLVVPMTSAVLPALEAVGIDAAMRDALTRAVVAAKFEGKEGVLLSLRGIGPWARIVLAGAGTGANGGRDAVGRAAQDQRDENAAVVVAAGGADAGQLALGYALGQYRFDRYKTGAKEPRPIQPVTIVTADADAANAAGGRWAALAEGVGFARDLSNEPANVIYPESFVARAQAALAGLANVRIEILDEAAMRRLNMGSLLGVGQGSRRPSRLMVVSYTGGAGAPLAIVGKGITFDSGGISIKPGLGMWQMKADMSGAAAAIGTVISLARSRAPVNVVAAAALAENMPGANAQRPGDVVRTMSGKTIEVLNTDAEGRQVMADATEYVVDRYKPLGLVTIATLTGAAAAALDDEYAAVFARDEPLHARIQSAAAATGEAVWRLPVHPSYAEDMKSDIADIRHVVEGGRPGAGLAAHFVQYFVPQPTPWAHLDIAGVFYEDKGEGVTPKGFTGWGVRLLDELARTGAR